MTINPIGIKDRYNRNIYMGDSVSFVISGPDIYQRFTGVVCEYRDHTGPWINLNRAEGYVKLDPDDLHQIEILDNPENPIFKAFQKSIDTLDKTQQNKIIAEMQSVENLKKEVRYIGASFVTREAESLRKAAIKLSDKVTDVTTKMAEGYAVEMAEEDEEYIDLQIEVPKSLMEDIWAFNGDHPGFKGKHINVTETCIDALTKRYEHDRQKKGQ